MTLARTHLRATAVLLLMTVVALSLTTRAAGTSNGDSAIDMMVAELRKQDPTTLGDVCMGLWREWLHDRSQFCAVMSSDTTLFARWLDGMRQTAFSAASDTALARIAGWKAELLDTTDGPYAGLASCREIDRKFLSMVRGTQLLIRLTPDTITAAESVRLGQFWFSLWRAGYQAPWQQTSARLLELLLGHPNELYDVFSSSPAEYTQFVNSLADLRFTIRDSRPAVALEEMRLKGITRLTSGVVGERFRAFNTQLVDELKQIRVERAP